MTLVECYSGTTYAERPVAVWWAGQRLAIAHVERQWHTPAGPAFRVRTTDGQRFELHYEQAIGHWTVQLLTDGAK